MIPRKLTPFDKQKLIDHFINDIVDDDRRLRFGTKISDDSVKEYIESSLQSFGYKNMWFVVDIGDRIVSSCHVSIDKDSKMAEMGCTVSADYRNKKIGQEMFNRGITWASMAGAQHVFMYCLSENQVIQHIARKGGMTVVTIDPSEKESTIKVKQNRFEAGFKDYVMDQIAVYDTTIRQQYFFTNKYLKQIMGR